MTASDYTFHPVSGASTLWLIMKLSLTTPIHFFSCSSHVSVRCGLKAICTPGMARLLTAFKVGPSLIDEGPKLMVFEELNRRLLELPKCPFLINEMTRPGAR